MKFEQDDKEFMLTEEVAAFCTTPGGRRRDDMNFYTSGMKIVTIKEEDQSLSSAQVKKISRAHKIIRNENLRYFIENHKKQKSLKILQILSQKYLST